MKAGGADVGPVNIPVPARIAKRGRRSEAAAIRRNGWLKRSGKGPGGKSPGAAESREYREAAAERTARTEHAPKKSR